MARLRVSSNSPFEEEYGYSRAVRVGDLVFVSGTTARSPDLAGDAAAQMAGALAIIERALGEAGAGFADVVRTVVYIVDMRDLDAVTRAHREAFGLAAPASTVVQVSGLTPPEARIEIEVTAMLGQR